MYNEPDYGCLVIYTHITFINNSIPCCTRHPRNLRPRDEVESCGMLVWRAGIWRPAFFTPSQEDVMKYTGSVNYILTRVHLTVLNYNKLWCTNVSSANKFRYISSSPRTSSAPRSLNSNPHWEENFHFHVILVVLTCKYSLVFSAQYVSYVM